VNDCFRTITDMNENRLVDLFVDEVRGFINEASKSGSYIEASTIRKIRNEVFNKSLKPIYSEKKLKEELVNRGILKSIKSVPKKLNGMVMKVYNCI